MASWKCISWVCGREGEKQADSSRSPPETINLLTSAGKHLLWLPHHSKDCLTWFASQRAKAKWQKYNFLLVMEV